MSGSQRRHRRRRTGSTARRYRPSELVPVDQRRRRIGATELLASAAVAVVAVLLIALVWIVTNRAIQDERTAVRDRTEQALAASATLLSDQVQHELLLIDQSIAIIQEAWKDDSDRVDLTKWKKSLLALTTVSSDIFIADEKHIIQQDIVPAAIGQGIGAAYVTFPHGSLETFDSDGNRDSDGRVEIGQTSTPIDGREFLIYVVRPLDHPKGWVVGASYLSEQLPKLFAHTNLGMDGIAALVESRFGGVEAIVGPAARRPNLRISDTPMFEAIQKTESGLWLGATPMDGQVRLTAFHRVPGRDLIAVVGTPLAQAMSLANDLAEGYRSIAAVATLLIVAIAALLMWGLYTLRRSRRRRRLFERSQADVIAAQTDLASSRARANLTAMQFESLVQGLGDGIAVLDAELCLSMWNPSFVMAARLDADALRTGLPLDELIRRQATAGAFGPLDDPEAEIARRVALLRTDRDQAELTQLGPEGETIELRCRGVPDGGLILILGGLLHWQPPPAVVLAEPTTEEPAPASAATIEW